MKTLGRIEEIADAMAGDESPPRAGVLIRDSGPRISLWAAVVVLVVVIAISGAVIFIYTRSPPLDFTGFRVVAPPNGCWTGNVGVAGNTQNVSGCGSRDIRMSCVGFISLNLTQLGPDVWTLTVIVYVNGWELQRTSQTGTGGTLVASEPC